MHFWSIDALPGPGSDDVPAGLNDALAQARAMLGETHFSLHDQIAGIAGPGQQVDQDWNPNTPGDGTSNLRYTISGGADNLSMMFRYNMQTSSGAHPGIQGSFQNTGLSTTLPIKLGQTVILSQTPSNSGDPAQHGTRLLLIRVDAVK